MIKFIKTKIAEYKKKKAEKVQLKKMQQYYTYLRYGVLFLQYINRDLEEQKTKNINRHARRRWEKEIAQSGKFSKEMIEFYAQKVSIIKSYIDSQLNPPKQKKVNKPKSNVSNEKKS